MTCRNLEPGLENNRYVLGNVYKNWPFILFYQHIRWPFQILVAREPRSGERADIAALHGSNLLILKPTGDLGEAEAAALHMMNAACVARPALCLEPLPETLPKFAMMSDLLTKRASYS